MFGESWARNRGPSDQDACASWVQIIGRKRKHPLLFLHRMRARPDLRAPFRDFCSKLPEQRSELCRGVAQFFRHQIARGHFCEARRTYQAVMASEMVV